jgi:2-polyprenyl-3-methyl-5-hydroxy-6-metoxy-1,4-benzoquinol methylase
VYREFSWTTEGPANGRSGEGLADSIVDLVRQTEGVETICDLGCGNGYITTRLASLGYAMTGIDLSQSGLEIARTSNGNARYVEACIDGRLVSRLGNAFDLVLSSDVIEHLYRPSDLLEAAHSLLKPDGRLIVTTPYHGYVKNLVLAISGKMDGHFSALHDGGHIKFFSIKTLSQLMERCGFTGLHFTFYGRAPWLWKNMICSARKAH